LKQFIILVGLGILLSNTIVMYLTFLGAFFNGNEILVTINNYGEMWIEFFFLPLSIALGVYVIYYFYKTLPTGRIIS